MQNEDKKIIDNSAAILSKMVELNRKVTQVELTSMLPLKRTSIYYIFDFLEKSGLIIRSGESMISGKGAPPILWQLNADAGIFLVTHFSTSNLCFATYDFSGNLISMKKIPSPENITDAIQILIAKIRELKSSNLCGVMVALPGIVEPASGEVLYSKPWNLKNFPLKNEIEDALPKDISTMVIVENRTRAAAWGEKLNGTCRSIDNFLILYLEGKTIDGMQTISGIGSSLVIDGRLFKGAHGAAGELEHIYYRWMTDIRKKYGSDYKFSFSTMTRDDIKTFGSCLGENFAHIVNYLAPQKIALIFDTIEASESFVAFFRQAFLSNLAPINSFSFPVEVSNLAENAVLCGSADLQRKAYFNHQNPSFIKHISDSMNTTHSA